MSRPTPEALYAKAKAVKSNDRLTQSDIALEYLETIEFLHDVKGLSWENISRFFGDNGIRLNATAIGEAYRKNHPRNQSVGEPN
jgi:hypothetical protein